jgi:signal transduction histidine kinase/CheY-like chemotaxis protein
MAGSEAAVNGGGSAGVALSPAVLGQLFDPHAWREGLERYAQATDLAVALTGADGRPLGGCVNPRPLWDLLRRRLPAGACPFGLAPPRPCMCVTDALARGGVREARDRTGLVHFAVPLVLGGRPLGALVAGQVFDQFPDQLVLEQVAIKAGLPPEEVWRLARLEHPVKQGTLRVYADLLATLGRTFLETRYHTLVEADRLAEMTRLRDQLQQRTQDLAEADRRKDEFLAMLAHELRNPLAPIRNAVQALRLLAPDNAEVRWAREVIERQVWHLSRLVEDLLDVSRFTRGRVTLRKEPTDLAAVAARAAESIRPAVEGGGLQLAVALPADRLWVDADPVRLAQVVGNLLNNAAKYTPAGGRIGLTAGREGGGAVLRVWDTGVGIAADMLPHVFDLFAQGDHTLDRAQGGLGIGLTLVRSLVELHGGSVRACSGGPDRGSEFVVRLPLMADPPGPGATPTDTGRGAAPPPRRVLVVDDNVDVAASLARFLELTGHDVRTAHDGPAALDAVRADRPEVVLLDIGLPGMDGYEVARRLRELLATAGVVLVALTGYGQEGDRRRSREAGFDHHLVKPVDPAALQELLASPGTPGRSGDG